MGKIIFWIVVFFLVLLALRLVSVHQTRKDARERRERDAGDAADGKSKTRAKGQRDDAPVNETMVKCTRCGVFTPKSSSVMTATGLACNDASCGHRR